LIVFVNQAPARYLYSFVFKESNMTTSSFVGGAASTAVPATAGSRLRIAVREERPLQIVGAINAYTARMAAACGFKALYLSGGGVAANSLGVPDLGISSMDDVLIDVRRITDACELPLLVDADTGWGGAFNIARTVKSFIKFGAAGLHIEDQVQAKRCGHRPGKEVVSQQEMVDRVKAAVDARADGALGGRWGARHDASLSAAGRPHTARARRLDACLWRAEQPGDRRPAGDQRANCRDTRVAASRTELIPQLT